jgi:hypothetical protein
VVEAADDPHRLARLFLDGHRDAAGHLLFRYWQNEGYEWKDGAYRKRADGDVRAGVVVAVKQEFDRVAAAHAGAMGEAPAASAAGNGHAPRRSQPVTPRKVTAGIVGNVLQAIRSESLLPAETAPPAWPDGIGPNPADLFVCRNAIVNLAVDATGVGRPVCDLFRDARMPGRLVPITITGGLSVTGDGRGGVHVPKKDLVACAQVLLQTRRLRVARELALADVLVQELENFRVRITPAANEVFGEWREGQHDDLVFALAMAAWVGENWPEEYTGPVVYNEWASRLGATPAQADEPPLWQHLREDLGIDPDGEWD